MRQLRLGSTTARRMNKVRCESMSAVSRGWCVGAVVALDGLLGYWLALSWLLPFLRPMARIDYLDPVVRAYPRVHLILFALAVTLPATFLLYHRTSRELPLALRFISLVVASGAAGVVLAFLAWRCAFFQLR